MKVTRKDILDQGRNELLPLYETVRTAERNGQKFGEALCRYRKLLRAQGNKDGLGFDAFLKKIGIARSSAYRWIGFVEGHFVPDGTKSPRSGPARKPRNTKFGSEPDLPVDQARFIQLLPFAAWQAAYRAALQVLHPDHGGSNAACAELIALWKKLEPTLHDMEPPQSASSEENMGAAAIN